MSSWCPCFQTSQVVSDIENINFTKLVAAQSNIWSQIRML